MLGAQTTNDILEKVKNASSKVFGEITKSISQGIVSGNNDVYLIDNSVIEEYQMEPGFLHDAYRGKDIGHGSVHDGGYKVFYPYYLNEKGKTVCVSEECLKGDAPHIYSYLFERKEKLLEREYFRNSSKAWYELWNPRKMEHFYNRKFVFSEIGYVNDFVIADECFYMDSACGAELKPEFQKYETFIYRYLNTQLATYVYKKVSVPKANGYSIYKNAFLKAMPVIIPMENLDFENMTDDDFKIYIYKLTGVSDKEIQMVENAKYSQA